MKIAIVGAGAVGGWYGGLLALKSHEVYFVTQRDYDIINQKGLCMRDAQGDKVVKIKKAYPDCMNIGVCDLIIIAAKSTANSTLPDFIKSLVGPNTLLLTLQNGMGNCETFASIIPAERIVAGLCFVCINRLSPGVVENTHSGYVRMASAIGLPSEAVNQCVALFSDAGIDCQSEQSLNAVLWKKLCWNIPFNGLAIAAGGITTDKIMAHDLLRERAIKLMKEVQAAADACGVPFRDEHIERQLKVTTGMGAYRPSSLIDYLEGREVEVEGLWGEPLRRGQAAGVSMPELARLKTEIELKLKSRA
ncbi:MAG: 2-dehydropantoate 2-reductase [Opitutae bacterium]